MHRHLELRHECRKRLQEYLASMQSARVRADAALCGFGALHAPPRMDAARGPRLDEQRPRLVLVKRA